MTEHALKILPLFFRSVERGEKTFEIRKADRDYSVGDVLVLKEWSPDGGYTGAEIRREVTYVLSGFDSGDIGLMAGHVCMGLAATDRVARSLPVPVKLRAALEAEDESSECKHPCDPASGCSECSGYWYRMIREGYWDERGHRWTARGWREMLK